MYKRELEEKSKQNRGNPSAGQIGSGIEVQ